MSVVPRLAARISWMILWMGAALATAPPSEAQGFRWPEEPENLQVLPSTVKGRELGSFMRSFATALGVRCQFCHAAKAGVEPDPMDLMTLDFASDANEMKGRARLMIRMVGAINGRFLAELERPAAERVEVACVTCHRGVSRPRMLQDVLAETIAASGVDAAIEQYDELREEHHGGFAYDFRPGALTNLGERLASGNEREAALRILALENERNPRYAYGFYVRGTVLESAGDIASAIAHFEKAVELAPENQKSFFAAELERVKNR